VASLRNFEIVVVVVDVVGVVGAAAAAAVFLLTSREHSLLRLELTANSMNNLMRGSYRVKLKCLLLWYLTRISTWSKKHGTKDA
jgi:uncharacterized membrane protein